MKVLAQDLWTVVTLLKLTSTEMHRSGDDYLMDLKKLLQSNVHTKVVQKITGIGVESSSLDTTVNKKRSRQPSLVESKCQKYHKTLQIPEESVFYQIQFLESFRALKSDKSELYQSSANTLIELLCDQVLKCKISKKTLVDFKSITFYALDSSNQKEDLVLKVFQTLVSLLLEEYKNVEEFIETKGFSKQKGDYLPSLPVGVINDLLTRYHSGFPADEAICWLLDIMDKQCSPVNHFLAILDQFPLELSMDSTERLLGLLDQERPMDLKLHALYCTRKWNLYNQIY